jgi:two-component system, NtrC family, nitrogen regulation response regulator NtrX
MKNRIFIVDDDVSVCRSLVSLLGGEGYQVKTFGTVSGFRQTVATNTVAVLMLDIALPDEDGLSALPKIRSEFPEIEVVMITGEATIQRAVLATKSGAYDFLEKPIDPARLLLTLRNLFAAIGLKRAVAVDREDDRYQIVGESRLLREMIARLVTVASTDSTVLITGENGTGKELVAQQIWLHSNRKQQPLIKLNCAALPHELAESELFGFRKGAFTGADRNRDGKFKAADGGTIFLDEIGDLSPAIQAKLLRVIENGEIEPLGSDTSETVDVRVITATNRDLEQLVANGKFRADLFYRLNIVPIQVPALRERREDIPLLLDHFLGRLSRTTGLGIKSLAADAIGYLSGLEWRGNIRELRNVVERCYIMSRSTEIDLEDVRRLCGVVQPDTTGDVEASNKLMVAVENFERSFLKAELEKHDGNISELARSLGIDRGNLSKKLKSYDLV